MTFCEQAFMANYLLSFGMGRHTCLWELLDSGLTVNLLMLFWLAKSWQATSLVLLCFICSSC